MVKIFTKKVGLILLAVVVAVGGIIWAIVANIQPKFDSGITKTPAANYVSGNGTASVLVDNYLYFVGGSVTTSSIQYGDNEYYAKGKMPETGIYRVRIDDSTPVVNYEYNNTYVDGDEQYEYEPGEDGYNSVVEAVTDWDNVGKKAKKDASGYNKAGYGIEAVVPKIAGHDKAAMWVFGNYLIYTSPHNRMDKNGKLLRNYLDFFRVDLDGKNHTKIYTTDTENLTTDNFTVWANSIKNIYLLVNETANNEIKRIDVLNPKKVSTLDTEVSDVVLPKADHYVRQSENESLNKVYGGVMGYVYYTKNPEDTNIGNQMYRCSIMNDKAELLAETGSSQEGSIFRPLAVTPYGAGNAQFVYLLKVENATTTIKVSVGCITNDNMNDFRYKEPNNIWGGVWEDGGNVKDVAIYANGYCLIGNTLFHYTINGTNMELGDSLNKIQNVDQVLAVFGNTAYVQVGITVYKVTPNGGYSTITIVPAKAASDDDDDTEPENTITLPVAILQQPHADQGDPMIFVQDANHIRLYDTTNGKFNYLKFKGA